MAPKTTQPESQSEKSFLNWLWIFVSVLLVNVTSIVIANYCFQFKILNGWPKKVCPIPKYFLRDSFGMTAGLIDTKGSL